jgi:hypothetical protein
VAVTRGRGSRAICAAIALAVATASLPAPVRAQSDDRKAQIRSAKAQYEEAERAYKGGDFRRAAELFEGAYKAAPHHSPLWNAARSWMRVNEDVRAANLLERYLREAPGDAPDRDRATQAITELDRRLGRIEFLKSNVSDVRLDGEPVPSDRLWVVPGEHVATADASGTPIRKVVAVAAGDRVSVTLEPAIPALVPPEPPRKPLPPWTVVIGGGLTLAGAGVTVWSGLDTLDKKDIFLRDQTQPALDDANAAEARTNVLLGVTIGVALITVIAAAFFVDWKGSKPARSSAFAPRNEWRRR